MTQLINPQKFTETVGLLRSFFLDKGFLEVHTQNRLSILAACEDPFNVATYNYAGQVWPLPQTGQMWLEHELLSSPDSKGFFCVSTSYRQEPNAVEGRHDIIFPMFEFEMPGDINDLKAMEYELVDYLGFKKPEERTYEAWQRHFELGAEAELEAEHENKMFEEFGSTMITDFPEFTSPFWNMSRYEDGVHSKKIDVILGGHETIGSAERSTDVDQMRDTFHTITDGAYSELLYDLFTKDRVEKELEQKEREYEKVLKDKNRLDDQLHRERETHNSSSNDINKYLNQIKDSAPSSQNAYNYGKIIYDLSGNAR